MKYAATALVGITVLAGCQLVGGIDDRTEYTEGGASGGQSTVTTSGGSSTVGSGGAGGNTSSSGARTGAGGTVSTGQPSGVIRCDPSKTNTCPTGQTCHTQYGTNAGLCGTTCTTTCAGENEVCVGPTATDKLCVQTCSFRSDCVGTGMGCFDPGTGDTFCIPDEAFGLLEFDLCDNAAQCLSHVCSGTCKQCSSSADCGFGYGVRDYCALSSGLGENVCFHACNPGESPSTCSAHYAEPGQACQTGTSIEGATIFTCSP